MRIGLNLLHATPSVGGVWNYIEYVVKSIAMHDTTNEYVIYVNSKSAELIPEGNNKFIPVLIKLNPSSRIQRVLFENTLLQLLAKKHKLDCMHWFSNTQALFNTVPGIVTVYDLLVFERPKSYPLLQRLYAKYLISKSIKHASVLAPMSYSTAKDIARTFGTSDHNMVTIPTPIDYSFKAACIEDVNKFRIKYCLPASFWLYVAHYYSHKNHVKLLHAFAELKETTDNYWPLVLRGDMKDNANHLKGLAVQLGIADDIIWLPRLESNEMPILYSTASALIFPSLFEGAGIPIVEAMACGCPIVASDIPTTREFAGAASILFDPSDVKSITIAMSKIQKDEMTRNELSEKGLCIAKQYHPEQIYKQIIKAYKLAYKSQ
ncbi:MAG: glycosyltransferase family 4 protein [Armatimonadota bacterium]